jgi:hypothetical protein
MAISQLSCYILTGRNFQPMVKMAADGSQGLVDVSMETNFTDGDGFTNY